MQKIAALLYFVCFASVASSQSRIDSMVQEQVEDVLIINDRSISPGHINLSRKQFLTMAGALEDPTRLLIKSPGISTANDQANSIIYHAMPSHYHQWSMYGARIVNPNHLSNAGTISDFPSRSAGGVNMLSGQVIGGLTFDGSPSARALGTTAGISDITLRTPYRTRITTNLSLIGLEAGYDIANKISNLTVNYRYSTVGLLTGLGLDFGGEEINYQDLSGKYSIKSSKGAFDFYVSLGTNSNNKSAIDSSIVAEFKDRQRIAYEGFIGILGLHHNHQIGDRLLSTAINVSQRSEDREAFAPFIELPADTILYDSRERLISLHHSQVVIHNRWTWGAHLESWLQDLSIRRRFPFGNETFAIEKTIEKTSLFAIPQVSIAHRISGQWNFDVAIGAALEFSENNYFNPVGHIGLRYQKGQLSADIELSRSAQGRSAELISDLFSDTPILGTHLAISANYFGLGLSTYFHQLDGIIRIDSTYGFNSLQNLDRVPISTNSGGINLQSSVTDVRIAGITASYTKDWSGWMISSNITFQTSSLDISGSSDSRAPLDYGHIANIVLGKAWSINTRKSIGFSASYHYRGGERQYLVSPAQSYEWGYTNYALADGLSAQLSSYQRADFRIYYKPSPRSTISLDVQNVTNRQNDAYIYYEPETSASTLRKQLGMIPILSWRVDW